MKRRLAKLHAESYLHFPLIRQMLSDPGVRFLPRAIDQTWHYSGGVPITVGGFNPMSGDVLYPAISQFADWLKAPNQSPRKLNFRDRLTREVIFAAHDYLHVWAYQAVRELVPAIGFTTKPITRRNIEDFAFCHLVTEAVATVGLDYWMLCQKPINEYCDIGSSCGPLTVPYQERYIDEYRKFRPDLNVQSPGFFYELAEFYCTGDFYGFGTEDLGRSPVLESWMDKELNYGEKQREYVRLWFSFLSHEDIVYTPRQLAAPLRLDQPWKKKLVRRLGELLWEKVKEDKRHSFTRSPNPRDTWKSPRGRPPDFRFLNLNEFRPDPESIAFHLYKGPNPDQNFKYFFYQYVSQFECGKFNTPVTMLFNEALARKQVMIVKALFKDMRRLEPAGREPRDMLVLN